MSAAPHTSPRQTSPVHTSPVQTGRNQLPKPRIGILGAGQLALMLVEAACQIDKDGKLAQTGEGDGCAEIVCAGASGDCAGRVAPLVEVDLTDAAAVRRFAETVDRVTIESENIDAAVLHGLNLYPNARAVGIAQDRLLEKRFFAGQGIGTAPFRPVGSLDELTRALEELGVPAILKTRRMGYDGKGQVRLTAVAQAESAWQEVSGVPCILEGTVPFAAEISLLAARASDGAAVFYPLTRNHHRDGILRSSLAPSHPELQPTAEAYLSRILQALDYVGVLAVEFFVTSDGHLLANEMAPRVHNSGHWTIEGAATSQFANHLRALLGLPLGSTASRSMVMLNCIGTMPPESETAAFPCLFRHDYGKAPRPGRKVGHLTFHATEQEAIDTWRARLSLQDSCL